MNRTERRLATAGIAVSLILGACDRNSANQPDAQGSRPVKLVELRGASNEHRNRYPGVIDATRVSHLSFQVGGLIEALPVKEAQEIEKGELIAKLDERDFRSSVNSARATFENAEDMFQRARRLAEQDAIATSVLEQRQSQRNVAKSQLESAEKALSDSVLRAPFSGIIASLPVKRLQTVAAGTPIATVINLESLDVTINLPASVIAQIPTRQDFSTVVQLDAAPGRQIEARFKKAQLVADATSQTYAVTYSFVPPENIYVLPGMNATVTLASRSNETTSAPSVIVPLASVQSDGNGQYVWVVDDESMTVSRRAIAIEPGIGEHVIVTSGLSPADRIVGAGGAYLAEGVKITPWTE